MLVLFCKLTTLLSDGYPRAVLGRMIFSNQKDTRILAINQLRVLAYAKSAAFRDWGIRMLVDALYDIDAEICSMAVEALDEACIDPDNLDMLIKLRPVLDHLGELAKPIFLRYTLFCRS